MCVCVGVLFKETCYLLLRHDVRGTVELVEKGCRPVVSCTRDMFLWSRGFCEGLECIQCMNNPATCHGPKGLKFKRFIRLDL